MNTAEILNFPMADMGIQEQRVADTDDGYTRLANELYEELIGANLTKNQAKVAHAYCRKTYGFNKKMDRIADTQIAKMTRLPRQKVNVAKKSFSQCMFWLKRVISLALTKTSMSGLYLKPRRDLSVTTVVTQTITTIVTVTTVVTVSLWW